MIKMTFRLFLFIIFTSVKIVSAQKNAAIAVDMPIDEQTKLITYTKVVDATGVAKNELYNRALEWCNTFYKNPADVIREKDEVNGLIVCKHRFKISNPEDKKSGVASDAGLVQYTLRIELKDGKFRYTMTEFNWKQPSFYACEKWLDKTNKYYSPNWDYYLQQTNQNAIDISTALVKAVITSKPAKKDDW